MCVTLEGLDALRHVLHVFGNVVHVGDVRPLLWVGVDAHIYQFPQLVGGETEKEGTGLGGWLGGKERDKTVNVTALTESELQRNEQTAPVDLFQRKQQRSNR